jgi:hypothetical protein
MTPISTRVGYILSLVALAGAFSHAFGQPRLISGKHPTRKMESAGPEVAEVKIPPFPGAHAVWGRHRPGRAGPHLVRRRGRGDEGTVGAP